MHRIVKKLAECDRRSIGRSNEVVAEVLVHPRLFPHLIAGLFADDAVIRMRAADAMEKTTARRHDLLRPFKKKLLAIATSTNQKELRWHLALVIPRLKLTPQER